ncbi:NAD(P)-dependent oxidoreductase [Xenorhabdus nematophila]|uniref:NAD(P)-dependent oxidoreductase n=1 Tax=Xenorhabdus nematophila TaxID=628 RepID=UPI0032B7F5DF
MKKKPNSTLLLTGCSLSKEQYYRYEKYYQSIIELPQPLSKSAILAQGACVTDYILGGPEYIDDAALKHFPELQRLVLLGTGIPSFVDQKAAEEHGVLVMNTPHMNVQCVAEFALSMIITCASGAPAAAEHVREGSSWPQQAWKTLSEQHIGIFGMGHIGQALVEKLYALGARQLTYTSRSRKPQLEERYALRFVTQKELLNECDSVSLHLSYNEQTHHLINQSALQKCNPRLRLLCFSNPHVIDPKAARAALLKGNLKQLYIDGYYREWQENLGQNHDPEGLLNLPRERFWATSHLAAQTNRAIERQLAAALDLLHPGTN